MNVTKAIRQRRTVRGFKPDPVPDQLLLDILNTARFSPSNCNSQPWHLSVVSGEPRERLEKALLTEIDTGQAMEPAFAPFDVGIDDVYKARQYDCAARYYGTMGIERHEKDKRKALMLKNWQFFGAPHVAFLSMPRYMGPVNAIDLGIYLQSLMLLFVEQGLASCPQGALAFYPTPIYAIAKIPEGNGILCGLSFGYENEGDRINKVQMDREPLASTVTLVS